MNRNGKWRISLSYGCAVIFFATLLLIPLIGASPGMAGGEVESAGGVVDGSLLGLDVRYYATNMQAKVPLAERQQVKHYKVVVSWDKIEHSEGFFSWNYYDQQISAMLADGAESIMLLLGRNLPDWAQDPAYGENAETAPPKNLFYWYRYVEKVAQRYGHLVDFYEIWNEPGWDRDSAAYQLHGVVHFGGQVETDYLPVLQLAHAAIKENDPTAKVICGALMYSFDPSPYAGAELYGLLYDDLNRPGQDVSVKLASGKEFIAERPMYFEYGGWSGGHDVIGANQASNEWYFAEGCTRDNFDTWLCLQNPNPNPIQVEATYMYGESQGPNKTVKYGLEPNSRRTYMLDSEAGEGKDVSVKITSGSEFIAERPMYFDYNGWSGGHDVIGANQASNEWYFAEGCTRDNFDMWLCLQNPNPNPIQVEATYMYGEGQGPNKTVKYDLQPTSRTNLFIDKEAGEEKDVSVKITSGSEFIAERPMYFDYNGWSGGHDVIGANQASNEWYFAEGCTGYSIQEYLCMQNPHNENITVDVTFMMKKGEVFTRKVNIPARSRRTLDINRYIGFQGCSDMAAVHPYKWPAEWGPFYTTVVQTLRALGANQEVVCTEIGWPHYSDVNPGGFSEAGQADALGATGVGGLINHGCKKIWIYRDLDEPPGKSWDNNYYGLFDYMGNPHPAWGCYKNWQNQLPDYPKLPGSI